MNQKIKWYHSLSVRITLVIALIAMLLIITSSLSLLYFDRLNTDVQSQADQKLPALEILNSTQLGITKLANLSGALSRSESPANSRVLMSKVKSQITEIQKGLDQLGSIEQVKPLKQIVSSAYPSMERISKSKERLDEADSLVREKIAQAIRLTTGAIVGADNANDVSKLNILLINLSQLLTVETRYEQRRITDNIKNNLRYFSDKNEPTHVYLSSVFLSDDGVIGALNSRDKYKSEVLGMDTQNRILLGNVVDYGQRVYARMENDVASQAERTIEKATYLSKALTTALIIQLLISILLILFLHKQLFTRLYKINNIIGRKDKILEKDIEFFDKRNEVGLIVYQLKEYLNKIDSQQSQIERTSFQLQTVIKHSKMKVAVIYGEKILFFSDPLKQMFPNISLITVGDFPISIATKIRSAQTDNISLMPEAFFDAIHQRWYDMRQDSIYWDENYSCLISFIDVTERVQVAKEYERTLNKVENEAYIDPLTRLFNRKMFDQQVALYDKNHENRKAALLLFDVDYFKEYNDCMGHLQGDKVLQMVASIIKRNAPESGVAIRYGGEEFLLLLPMKSQIDALNIAQTIVEDIAAQEVPHIQSPHRYLSVSCGVSLKLSSNESLLNTFDQADKSLYRAKSSGRNCVSLFSKEP